MLRIEYRETDQIRVNLAFYIKKNIYIKIYLISTLFKCNNL